MPDNNFFLKPDYRSRTSAPRTVTAAGEPYWNKTRRYTARFYQYAVYQAAARLLQSRAAARVLDVGCGSGYKLAHYLAPYAAEAVGVDQPFIIERCASDYPTLTWRVLDLENSTETIGEPFSVIISADVIEHLVNPDNLLTFIAANADSETDIIISTPERDVLHGSSNTTPMNKDHIREWNEAEFRTYLTASGFTVKSITLVETLRPHFSRHYWDFFKKHRHHRKHTMMAHCRLT